MAFAYKDDQFLIKDASQEIFPMHDKILLNTKKLYLYEIFPGI